MEPLSESAKRIIQTLGLQDGLDWEIRKEDSETYEDRALRYDVRKDSLHIWSGLGSDDYWFTMKNVSEIPPNEFDVIAEHLLSNMED